jgi:hypothetical protein
MSTPSIGSPTRRRSAIDSTSHGGLAGGYGLVGLAIVGAIAVAMPGCSKARRDLAVVTGKVTYNGAPLRFGTVIFQPEAGQYATGLIRPDGSFQMQTRGEGGGVPVGKNRVRFVCFAHQDPSKPVAAKGDGPPSEGSPMGPSLIPQKYLSCATSGIIVDVRPGENEPLTFDLTDD